jgi:hypothetical protein
MTETQLAAYIAEHGHEPFRIRLRRFQLYIVIAGIGLAVIAPIVTMGVILIWHPGASLSP